MALNIAVSSDDRLVTMSIIGHFDLSIYREYAQILRQRMPKPWTQYIIDMSEMDHIHDSGLGMLLMLRERLGEQRINIIGCSPKIKSRLSRFGFTKMIKC